MPITTSAKKALRRDQRKEVINRRIRQKIKKALKAAREKPSRQAYNQAAKALDLAAKKNVIHKNKASRLKSRLAKLTKKSQKAKKKKA